MRRLLANTNNKVIVANGVALAVDDTTPTPPTPPDPDDPTPTEVVPPTPSPGVNEVVYSLSNHTLNQNNTSSRINTGLKLFSSDDFPEGFILSMELSRITMASNTDSPVLSCADASLDPNRGFNVLLNGWYIAQTININISPVWQSMDSTSFSSTITINIYYFNGKSIFVDIGGSVQELDLTTAGDFEHDWPLTIGGIFSSYDTSTDTGEWNRSATIPSCTINSLTVTKRVGRNYSAFPMSVKAAVSELNRYPSPNYIAMNYGNGNVFYNYQQGLELFSLQTAAKLRPNMFSAAAIDSSTINDYIVEFFADKITTDGTISTTYYDPSDNFELDRLMPLRCLFDITNGNDKYYRALTVAMNQLYNNETYTGQIHTRTNAGPFYHKRTYASQVWADGPYMYGPLRAQYAATYLSGSAQTTAFTDLITQLSTIAQKLYNSGDNLYRHAWDESGASPWIDPNTDNQSYFTWSRGMGWFIMGMIDIIEYIPTDHPMRSNAISLFTDLVDNAMSRIDQTSGVWKNIWNTSDSRNYPECSGSCMIAYALMKGERLGILSSTYGTFGANVYQAILTNFITENSTGVVTMNGIAAGGSPGNNNSTQATVLDDYFGSARLPNRNNVHGTGPFILASVEYELR